MPRDTDSRGDAITPRKKTNVLQDTVDRWNAETRKGDVVELLADDTGKDVLGRYPTMSDAFILSGREAVVLLRGVPGACYVARCRKVVPK